MCLKETGLISHEQYEQFSSDLETEEICLPIHREGIGTYDLSIFFVQENVLFVRFSVRRSKPGCFNHYYQRFGTDVMIFYIFSPKNSAKKLAFFDSNHS
jgi:hypothetical protein